MGRIVLANDKGQKVEFTFEGKGHFRACEGSKGTCVLDKSYHFVETDHEFIEPPKEKPAK